MHKTLSILASNLKINLTAKKKECYFFDNKEINAILNSLWSEKLIWGYNNSNNVLKVHLKYYLNKPIIQSIIVCKVPLKLKKLKKLTQHNPQSIFILKTNHGYKSHYQCFKQNISGILVLKIN